MLNKSKAKVKQYSLVKHLILIKSLKFHIAKMEYTKIKSTDSQL